MDITLLFLAKSVDKHGITLLHTYIHPWIIWGLKFRGPKCTYFGLKFRLDEVILGVTFLCPSTFIFSLRISGRQLIVFGGFENVRLIVWGPEKIA